MSWLAIVYILPGALSGFLAGLFGVGGGLIIVPSLIFIFSLIHLPETHILHLALGTSLATIIFTSISSIRAHHSHGAVNWHILKSMTPGILIGTGLGTCLATRMNGAILKSFFILFLLYTATRMLLKSEAKPSWRLPGRGGIGFAGGVIGGVSSLVGIGGGTLSVPFLVRSNVTIHEAIGTSAAIGFPIAIAGTAGYILNGLSAKDLPASTFGYLYLPALIVLVCGSMVAAPFGVRLSHRLPVNRLKHYFGLLLYILAMKMIIG